MNRKIINYLLGFYIFFTLYNTLIPFHFDLGWSQLGEQIRRISWKMYILNGKPASLTDLVGNVILFIPFGFLMYTFLLQRDVRGRMLKTVLAGGLLSFTIEFLQLFIHSRDTALHDLVNNTLGSGIGAIAAMFFSRTVLQLTRRMFLELNRTRPVLLIVLLILFGQTFSAIMPFTVSISVSSLVQSVKETNLIPFAYKPVSVLFFGEYSKEAQFQLSEPALDALESAGVPPEIVAQLGPLQSEPVKTRRRFLNTLKDLIGRDHVRQYGDVILTQALVRSQEEQFDITQMLENLLFWMAVGYLTMMCFSLYFAGKGHSQTLWWLLPPLFFAGLESLQLIITSRVSDVNDIIGGTAGVYLGYALYRLFPPGRADLQTLNLRIFRVPALVYLAFMFFSGFRPFDWSPAHIHKDLMTGNLVPFYAYFRKTTLWNIYDLVHSLTFFLPVSLYWSALLKQRGKGYGGIYVRMGLAGLCAGLLIEFAQLLSDSRVAEITDVIAYAGSGALGTFLLYYYEHQIAPAARDRKAAASV